MFRCGKADIECASTLVEADIRLFEDGFRRGDGLLVVAVEVKQQIAGGESKVVYLVVPRNDRLDLLDIFKKFSERDEYLAL